MFTAVHANRSPSQHPSPRRRHLKALRRSLEFPPGAQLLSLKAGLEVSKPQFCVLHCLIPSTTPSNSSNVSIDEKRGYCVQGIEE